MMKFFFGLAILVLIQDWWVLILGLSLLIVLFMSVCPNNEREMYLVSEMGLDKLSFSLVFLSIWMIILMVMASQCMFLVKSSYFYLYSSIMMSLLIVLVLSFVSLNYLMFYFFFEVSLIPTILMIMGWGYQPERLQASVYFLLYTLFASLPLLLMLIYLQGVLGGLFMGWEFILFQNTGWLEILMMIFLVSAFLVSVPMFLIHLWLPKAHVEAPVAGSMILAGVLLKLGGYGLSRLLLKISNFVSMASELLVSLSLLGMVYVGFMCLRVSDLSMLVAYSSVAHMALMLCGLLSGLTWGVFGCFLMMLSHGLSSSGLFCFVNILYERLHSRSIYVLSGLITVAPVLSLFMFLLVSANISAPPSLNLVSEIFLMASVLGYNYFMMIVFPLGSFLGAVFTLFMFSNSQHGSTVSSLKSFGSENFLEFHVLFFHVFPLNYVIVSLPIFIVWVC